MLRHNILAVMAIAITGMSSCVSGPQLYRGENAIWDENRPKLVEIEIPDSKNSKGEIVKNDPILSYTEGAMYVAKIKYARSLANYYMEQAGGVSQGKDAVALGLIAAAGVATGGLLYDANVNLIKGAGLAAGSLTVLNTYANSEEAETGLLAASEALICISDAAEGASNLASSPAAEGALYSATLQVRVNLRKRLSRKVIDYGTLLDTYKAASQRSRGSDPTFVPMDVETLKAQFAECRLRVGA